MIGEGSDGVEGEVSRWIMERNDNMEGYGWNMER